MSISYNEELTKGLDYCGYHILHADDMAINRALLKKMLEPLMFDIDSAHDGREAFRMFRENLCRYSLVFMDMEMPVMDGCKATRMIRSIDHPRAKKVPIIALTSNNSQEDIDRCFNAGMNAHLTKPYNMAEMLKVLKYYLVSS